jgi:hypothetical protein
MPPETKCPFCAAFVPDWHFEWHTRMSLTKEEREFLDAYVYEATHEPFGGPATDDLRRRRIYYADLHGLLTGYHRELCGERILPFGKHTPSPPPSPWANRDEAESRNRALLEEIAQTECKQEIAPGADQSADSAPAFSR